MPGSARGYFVVLEGLEGAGTTTVAGLLAQALKERDLRVHMTAEPTDGPFGRLLRRHVQHEVTLDPSAAALLFTADRADHASGEILPAIGRGEWVVCDRYLLSTLAYQGAEGVDRRSILAASAHLPVPDVTFYLDVPDDVRSERMSVRDRVDRYEDPALGADLRASYGASIDLLRDRGDRIEVIDGSLPAEEVVATVLSRLDAGA
jgi:dTMP kinase